MAIPQRKTHLLPFLGFHKRGIAPATAVPAQAFFENTPLSSTNNPNNQYQNFGGNIPQGVELDITHLAITPTISFAILEASGTADDAYNYYLANTIVRVKLGSTPVFTLPLKHIVPMRSFLDADGAWMFDTPESREHFFELPAPIHVKSGGKISVEITPAAGLTTAASAATNPHFPNLDGAAASTFRSYCHDVELLGYQHTDDEGVTVGNMA